MSAPPVLYKGVIVIIEHRPKHRVIKVLALVVALGIMVASSLVIYDYYRLISSGDSTPNLDEITDDTAEPSEHDSKVTDDYKVPADQPRVLAIDSLGVNSYIQKVGVTKSNAMATPSNVSFTGWYTRSVAPGNNGLSILNGHVGGRYRNGVFHNLNKITVGDTIRVQMGDMSWREFRVKSARMYKVEESAEPLLNDDPTIDKELHLITCDGTYDSDTKTYTNRFIVVAEGV